MSSALHACSMGKELRQIARDAIDAAACTVTQLGEESGIHHVTLRRWRAMLLDVRPENARKLADALERRALRLLGLSARLRARADTDAGENDAET